MIKGLQPLGALPSLCLKKGYYDKVDYAKPTW